MIHVHSWIFLGEVSLPFFLSSPLTLLFYHSSFPVSSSHRGCVSTPPLMSNLPTTHSRKSLSVQEERSVSVSIDTASYPERPGYETTCVVDPLSSVFIRATLHFCVSAVA